MPDSLGDAAQIRLIGKQIAKSAIVEFVAEHPELARREAEIPAPLKWAGGIVAALFTAGIATLAGWLVISVSEMQVTLARMDERMALQGDTQTGRMTEMERRIVQLEQYHRVETGR